MESKRDRVRRRHAELQASADKPPKVTARLERIEPGIEKAGDDEALLALASGDLNGMVMEIRGWTLDRERAATTNKKLVPARRKEWAELQAEVDRLRKVNPTLSDEQVFKKVAATLRVSMTTMRRRCR